MAYILSALSSGSKMTDRANGNCKEGEGRSKCMSKIIRQRNADGPLSYYNPSSVSVDRYTVVLGVRVY